MDKIRPINGWGEGKPVHECEGCEIDTRGRTLHLVDFAGVPKFYCDRCYAEWNSF